MSKRLAKRALKKLLRKSTFTDPQKEKFTEYLMRWLDTPEGSKTASTLDAVKLIDALTDWIAVQEDYNDEFWRASAPRYPKKRGWRRWVETNANPWSHRFIVHYAARWSPSLIYWSRPRNSKNGTASFARFAGTNTRINSISRRIRRITTTSPPVYSPWSLTLVKTRIRPSIRARRSLGSWERWGWTMGRYRKADEDKSGLKCPYCNRDFFTQYQFDIHLYFKHGDDDAIHPGAKRDIRRSVELQALIVKLRAEP